MDGFFPIGTPRARTLKSAIGCVGVGLHSGARATLAADADNQPFRENGKLLFRPGGHGALIENLNDIDADVVFIKNIDNVTIDKLKKPTITYKRLL